MGRGPNLVQYGFNPESFRLQPLLPLTTKKPCIFGQKLSGGCAYYHWKPAASLQLLQTSASLLLLLSSPLDTINFYQNHFFPFSIWFLIEILGTHFNSAWL